MSAVQLRCFETFGLFRRSLTTFATSTSRTIVFYSYSEPSKECSSRAHSAKSIFTFVLGAYGSDAGNRPKSLELACCRDQLPNDSEFFITTGSFLCRGLMYSIDYRMKTMYKDKQQRQGPCLVRQIMSDATLECTRYWRTLYCTWTLEHQ